MRLTPSVVLLFSLFCVLPSARGATIIGAGVGLDSLLIPGGSLTVGDKQFADFSFSITGDMPGADGVTVLPIQDDDGNYGIRFQGNFIDNPGGSGSDAVVDFTVTALDMNMLISDAHLAASTTLTGAGLVQITETFLPSFPTTMLVVYETPGGAVLTDEVDFAVPVRTLPVQKDILLFSDASAGSTGGSAVLEYVDQTFSQIPDPNMNNIPEPASMVLAVIAGLGLIGVVRRRTR